MALGANKKKDLIEWEILLDMDGVVVNMIKSVLRLFDIDVNKFEYPVNVYAMEEIVGVSRKEIWTRINAAGSQFWRDMEEYSWTQEFIKELKKYGEVITCTSPSKDSNCPKGKIGWLQDRNGIEFRDYILTHQKFRCAKKNSILIDDYENNCKLFVEAGGKAILFPQPWNSNYNLQGQRFSYIFNKLKYITNK